MKSYFPSHFLLVAIVAFTIPGVQTALAQCPEGYWANRAPMPVPRRETASAVVDGKVYVFGDNQTSPINNRLEVYDPQADSWTQLADMPTGRGTAAAAAVGGIIYVIGGNNCFSNCWLTTNEAYDTAAGTWTSLAAMPTRRGQLSATAVNGKIYAMGGGDSYVHPSILNVVEIYDPVTNTWSTGPVMPRRRGLNHAAVLLNGKIYLIGGGSDDPSIHAVPEVDVLDTVTDQWTQVAPLPTPRTFLTGVTVGGRIYAIGGKTGWDSPPYLSSVEEYDPQLDCWRAVTPLPSPQARHCGGVVDGEIFAIGGLDASGPLASNLLGVPRPLAGDVNGDGVVNGDDISPFLQKLLNP